MPHTHTRTQISIDIHSIHTQSPPSATIYHFLSVLNIFLCTHQVSRAEKESILVNIWPHLNLLLTCSQFRCFKMPKFAYRKCFFLPSLPTLYLLLRLALSLFLKSPAFSIKPSYDPSCIKHLLGFVVRFYFIIFFFKYFYILHQCFIPSNIHPAFFLPAHQNI